MFFIYYKSLKVFIISTFLVIGFGITLYSLPDQTFKMSNVPITKYNFVFMETQGNIQEAYADEVKAMSQYVLKYGISNPLPAILFVEYGVPDVYTPQRRPMPSGTNKLGVSLEKTDPITYEFLKEKYGEGYLNSTRKVLAGVLVFPNIRIAFNDEVKVFTIEGVTVKSFQSLMFVGDKPNEYTKENRTYDRTVMFRYMNSTIGKKNSSDYLGMLETLDNQNNVITFIALPGDQKKLFADFDIKGISPKEIKTDQTN